MKRVLLILISLPLFVFCRESEVKNESEVTVMSYNMLFEHNVPLEPERQWISRKPNIIATINSVKPDIIGSQELLSWQVAGICRGTGYKRIGKSLSGTVSDTDNSENECIFYNPARLKCLNSGDFWFNTHPDSPGPATGTTYNRKCTWGYFKVVGTDKTFYLFNSHFYYETQVYRNQCAEVLVQKISKIVPNGAAVVLTGDFNADVPEESIQKILDAGFRESRNDVANPEGPSGSYYGFNLTQSPSALLDHVFLNSQIKADRYEIINSQIKTRKIESDHLPVFVKISFVPSQD